jgi:gas vesicle protein
MAYEYDRFEREEGGGSFLMGLLAGTVLGAGLGMLFAPKAGSELRGQISEQAGNLANQASEGYRKASESAGQWAEKGRDAAGEWAERGKDIAERGKDLGKDIAERGKDIYGKARDAAAKGAGEAEKFVRDAASNIPGATPATSGSSGSGSSFTSGSSFGTDNVRGAGSDDSRGSTAPSTTPGTRRS